MTTPSANVFPAGLLIEGRPCLVVGGGRIATRKVQHLLEAGASVEVVSPEVSEDINALSEKGAITLHRRKFNNDAVQGMVVVFAATGDRDVNRRVLQCCRDSGATCCSVDGNWCDGDFVTPATLRKEGLTISISTGGKSCRRSRLIKENLGRHIDMVATADLLVIGTSHHHLAAAAREPYHLVGDKLELVGQMLSEVWGIHEFMILNTCNRVEILAVVARNDPVEELLKRILAFFHLRPEQYYVKRGMDAFRHVTTVAAGLRSQTPGEHHIVAQVKEALDHAISRSWSASMMQEWISSALHVSKEIRVAVADKLHGLEIEDLCVRYLESRTTPLKQRKVLVVGTGRVGSGLIRELRSRAAACAWCYHTNRPDPTDTDGIKLIPLENIYSALTDADIVVCATTSPEHVVGAESAQFHFDAPTDVIDLAMPRNVDPGVASLPNVTLADLDDLKHWYRREMADMNAILKTARQVTLEHAKLYEHITEAFQGRDPA